MIADKFTIIANIAVKGKVKIFFGDYYNYSNYFNNQKLYTGNQNHCYSITIIAMLAIFETITTMTMILFSVAVILSMIVFITMITII